MKEVFQVEIERQLEDALHVLEGPTSPSPFLASGKRAGREIAVGTNRLVSYIVQTLFVEARSLRGRDADGFAVFQRHAHSLEGFQYSDHYALHISRSLRRRSEEHTSELQSRENLVCRLLLE